MKYAAQNIFLYITYLDKKVPTKIKKNVSSMETKEPGIDKTSVVNTGDI